MKTLIIYYSYSGNTRKIAEATAEAESADILEVKPPRNPGKFKAYFIGCPASIMGKSWKIQPLDVDLSSYEKIIIMSPIWAGGLTPYINAILEQLPEGKAVYIKLISGSGKSDCRDRLETKIRSKGCRLEDIEDIKA